MGLCECGCGQETRVVRGVERRFIQHHAGRVQWGKPGPLYEAKDCGYETDCWVWLRVLNRGGYGRIKTPDGPIVVAHRVFYERVHGPIPDGYQIDHLCRNPPCVNPDHLEPVTPRENTRRGLVAKLTAEQVAAIRAIPRIPRPNLKQVAAEHGVRVSTIQHLRSCTSNSWLDIGPASQAEKEEAA